MISNNLPGSTQLPSDPKTCISIKRCHGLGNVFCLLAVLDRIKQTGQNVHLVTRTEWIPAFSALRPQFSFSSASQPDTIDLDEQTKSLTPCEHRTDEFGRLLGIAPPFASLHLAIPDSWIEPFEFLRHSIVFAPEGGHRSRTWPTKKAVQLKQHLPGDNLVLIGTDPSIDIPCSYDTRGQLAIEDLLAIISLADAVITMDSAVLHIAAALKIPTVAIFGGINPAFRVRRDQPVVIIQAKMDCCPCNKNEICSGTFPCINAAGPQDIVKAVALAQKTKQRIINHIPLYKLSFQKRLV